MIGFVSLLCLLAALLPACNAEEINRDHPVDELHFPIGVTTDSSGEYVYVVNSNFDLAYRAGNVVALNTATHRLVKNSAVMVPGFGARIRSVNVDGKTRRLYLTAREMDSIAWMDVSHDEKTGEPRLVCTEEDASEYHLCDGKYWRWGDDSGISAGGDPFGLAIIPPSETTTGYLYTGSFEGQLTAFSLNEDGALGFSKQIETVTGLYELAFHPLSQQLYATSKFSNVLMHMDVIDSTEPVQIEKGNDLIITNGSIGVDFGRGMKFNKQGSQAYVAYRSPPSLLVVDTTLTTTGAPRNTLLGAVPLSDGPAGVAVAPSGPDGRELVYVTLFDSNQVAVVDPVLMTVVDVIDVGDGPFDIAIAQTDEIFRAFVTLFEEGAVAVIELKKNAFYHQEIARVP